MKSTTPILIVLCLFVQGLSAQNAPESPSESVKMTVFADQITGELKPIWNWFGYDEANLTFHPEGIKLLKEIAEIEDEPAKIRVHHLLTSGDAETWLKWSSTNAYSESASGSPKYDWSTLDLIFDTYREIGVEPYVQIGFMPQALSALQDPYTPKPVYYGPAKGMVQGGAFHPPVSLEKWSGFIKDWVRHCQKRYGKKMVRQWYWELWNEPNGGYWKGTWEEFFELYSVTAEAVKSVDAEIRFGGPHITNTTYAEGGEFLRQFLASCREEKAPLDFIAFHVKGGTSWETDHVKMNAGNQLKLFQSAMDIISEFPEFKELPMVIGESDPDGCAACTASLYPQNRYRNGAQFASWAASTFLRKQALAEESGMTLDGAISWSFTFPGQPWFDGFRSLSTNGVPKPVFNAFRAMGKLRDLQLKTSNIHRRSLADIMENGFADTPDVELVATKNEAGDVSVLVWHYHDEDLDSAAVDVKLFIEGLNEGDYEMRHYRVDDDHSNAYTSWKAMGSPQAPSPSQIKQLELDSELTLIEQTSQVSELEKPFELNLSMPRQSISVIELRRVE